MRVTSSLYSIFSLVALLATVPMSPVQARDSATDCIVRPAPSAALRHFHKPATVRGLAPQIMIPREGELQLVPAPDRGNGDRAWSPTGDFTRSAGPYDPVGHRLFVWGYFTVGWIEVQPQSGTWLFGDSGTIKPRLYDRWDDGKGDSVRSVLRSEVLGVQFYAGWTAPHWLTGHRSYRVYELSGVGMRRVAELERRTLLYVGDDPVVGMAVFFPEGVTPLDHPRQFVWYDGASVIEPPSGSIVPNTFCEEQAQIP